MADDPVDITEILELKKINEKLRNEVGTRDVTLEEYRAAKNRSKNIGFDDPKSKGDLVPSSKTSGLRKLLPLLRKGLSRLNPALGLADLAITHRPSEEEMQEHIKKAGELPKLREDPMGDLKSGLETAIDFITPSKTYKRKLSPTEIEFFEDVTAEGDNYDLLADAPSAKISIDSKGKKFLEVAEEDMDSFMNWIGNEYTLNMGYDDMPTHIRTGSKWHLTFKDEEGKNYWENTKKATGGVIRNPYSYTPRDI